MSGGNLRLQVVLQALDQATAPFRKVMAGSRGLASALQAQQATLRRLNNAQRDVSAYRQQQQALRGTEQSYQQAQARVAALAQGESGMSRWLRLVPLAIGALVPAWGVTQLAPPARAAQAASENVVEYSPQLLDRLRADNRVVFVNMTADWCVSCKANERAVLSRPEFKELLKRTNAVYMRGDYTNVDPQITTFLEEHKAVGVPLYVVYGPGAPPTVLPTLLTQAVVEEALLRTAR